MNLEKKIWGMEGVLSRMISLCNCFIEEEYNKLKMVSVVKEYNWYEMEEEDIRRVKL